MELQLAGLRIGYQVAGAGQPLLLLHGWGVDRSTLQGLFDHLSQYMQVYALDFPGFGESEPPTEVWGVPEYAAWVQQFCAALAIEKPVLLGHSFGGRVSILLGARGFASKIILTDAAGILPKRGADYYARVYSYKAAKKIMQLPGLNRYYDKAMGHWQKQNSNSDYAQAQGIMRQILVKTVNYDLEPYLPQIAVPTLLLWGEKDTATPLSDGQRMEQLIPDSGLVVFKGAGHYPFLEQPVYFCRVLDSFLNRPEE